MNINERLKKWLLSTEMFKKLNASEQAINKIFSSEESEREKKSIEYAKKIWKEFPELGPTPFFDVLSEQERKRSFFDNYRDHTTHQVKVLILGAYIYEECDRIRNAVDKYLMDELKIEKEKCVDTFMLIWIVTSLYHDIGYLIECKQEDDNDYWAKIYGEYNDVLCTPLAHTKELNITVKLEEDNIESKIKKMKSFNSLQDEELFDELKEFGVCSSIVEDDNINALKEYYSFAQENNVSGGRGNFRDHGIASALMLLKIWKEYIVHLEKMLQYKSKNKKVNTGIDKVNEIYKKIDFYDSCMRISAGAISLHNIKKNYWEAEKLEKILIENFCIELEDENALPIAFLLRLVDELQDWDRMYYRPIRENDNTLSGNDMDLYIKDGKICLSYFYDNRTFIEPEGYKGARYVQLKTELSMYLSEDIVEELLCYDVGEKGNDTSVDKLGLKNIYTLRSEAHDNYAEIGFAKKTCDIIAFGLHNLRTNIGDMVEKSVKKGLKIRILTMQPDSALVKLRESQEGVDGNIRNTILELLIWINELKKSVPKDMVADDMIQVKFYDSLPLEFYCKIDEKIYVGPYMAGKQSGDIITYEYGVGSIRDMYINYFNNLWNGHVKGIKATDKAYIYNIREQEEIVQHILKSFCGMLVDFNNVERNIRGITVKYLEKTQTRKTIFFWNKKKGDAIYPEKEKKFGVVGQMSDYKCPYLYYFSNKGAYYHISTADDVKVAKEQGEGGKKVDQKVILVAPIWDAKYTKIMGVVTFEYMKEPLDFELLDKEIEQYNRKKNNIDETSHVKLIDESERIVLKWPEINKLNRMLNIARECADILSYIIINYMVVDEQKLFENEEYKDLKMEGDKI